MKKVIVIEHSEEIVHIIPIPEMELDNVEEFLADGNKNEVESFSIGNISYQVVSEVNIKIY